MKNKDIILSLNSAIFLYRDALHFLKLSSLREKSTKILDFKTRNLYARISIFLFQASIDAHLNYMLYNNLNISLSHDLKKQLEKLPYDTKLAEVLRHSNPNRKTIKGTKLFHQLQEIAELRNSFVHPKILNYYGERKPFQNTGEDPKIEIELEGLDRTSRFKYSGLEKNFMLVDYRDAIICKEVIKRLVLWLEKNIPGNKGNLVSMSLKESRASLPHEGAALSLVMKGKGENLIDFFEYYHIGKNGFGKR